MEPLILPGLRSRCAVLSTSRLGIIPVLALAAGCVGCTGTAHRAPESDTASASRPATDAVAPARARAAAAASPAPGPVAVNAHDPISGLPIDPAIAPVVVVIDSVRPPLIVAVGTSSQADADRVAADGPRYAAAALHDGIVTDPLRTHDIR
jgi:hypothetical protein